MVGPLCDGHESAHLARESVHVNRVRVVAGVSLLDGGPDPREHQDDCEEAPERDASEGLLGLLGPRIRDDQVRLFSDLEPAHES